MQPFTILRGAAAPLPIDNVDTDLIIRIERLTSLQRHELGPWAFETSAYAAITDWPRGGIVGLHGTSETWSVGLRASHGCLRVYNKVILALKKRVRPGTPLRIRA